MEVNVNCVWNKLLTVQVFLSPQKGGMEFREPRLCLIEVLITFEIITLFINA